MSIPTGNRAIAPVLWPGGLGRSDSSGFDLQVRRDWRYVPESVDEMLEWAAIGMDDIDDPAAERDRRYLLYNSNVLPDKFIGTECRVTVVLQGFLGKFKLTTLGNWTGREKDAAGALQYLELEAGGCVEAFETQTRALENLRQFVSMKVGACADDRTYSGDRIFLERRVFTKLRAVTAQSNLVRLHDGNDPRRLARKISHKWVIDHVIHAGARRGNGENTAIAVEALKPGDFVEVSVSADIFVGRRRTKGTGAGGGGTVVRFGMHEVVRLWTAEEAEARWSAPKKSLDVRVKRAVTQMPSGFRIGEKKTITHDSMEFDTEMTRDKED